MARWATGYAPQSVTLCARRTFCFLISAPGYETLITHVFPAGDEHLGSDTVFDVKDSLVADCVRSDSPESAARYGTTARFYEVSFDFGPGRDCT